VFPAMRVTEIVHAVVVPLVDSSASAAPVPSAGLILETTHQLFMPNPVFFSLSSPTFLVCHHLMNNRNRIVLNSEYVLGYLLQHIMTGAYYMTGVSMCIGTNISSLNEPTKRSNSSNSGMQPNQTVQGERQKHPPLDIALNFPNRLPEFNQSLQLSGPTS